jgi:phosphatidylethanolamine/phosphatidyl-N-methylethanolamine N-methyltransferase
MRRFGLPMSRMSHDSRTSAAPVAHDHHATWTFFRQWLKNPRAMAAFSPSSRRLARRMIEQLPPGTRRVVELGGGTGVFTRALLEHGIRSEHLLVLELNHALYDLLRKRFPSVRVVHGDARDLATIVGATGFGASGDIDAVVSGLGFLAMPRTVQRAILAAVFAVLGPGRPLIQFTYGPSSPLPRDLLEEMDIDVRRASLTWLNIPPAAVYVYTRRA